MRREPHDAATASCTAESAAGDTAEPASDTSLKIDLGGVGGTAAHTAAPGAPPALELSADIDIRQNRYQGWHPVAGTWDPARGAVQHPSDRTGAPQRDGVRDAAGVRGVSRSGQRDRLPGAAPGEQQEPQPGHPDRRVAVAGVQHRRRRHRLPDRRRRFRRRHLPEPVRARCRRLAAGAHRHRGAQPGAVAARLGRGRVPRPASLPADPRLCSR